MLGHPYGANAERGVFRTTDGGKTWEKVLYKDENTGAVALAFDPADAQTVYAVLWAARQGPWENGAWQGTGSGLFKSTDGGTTWKPLTKGLPTAGRGAGPHRHRRVAQRSRSGSTPWSMPRGWAASTAPTTPARPGSASTATARLWGRGSDFAEVKVDPKNKDVVYVANTSPATDPTDGGKTFTCIKGAPGGDDYHTVWINPGRPAASSCSPADQGAIVTVNGGETWSSWYNQPTAQFYHVITDNQFPYWVYGGQQESGSAGVRQPRQRRADHLPRLAPRRRRGVRLRRPRSARTRTSSTAARSRASTAAPGQVQNVAPEAVRGQVPLPAHRPAALLAGRSASPLLRRQRAVQDDERRALAGTSSAPTCRARRRRCPRASASSARRQWRSSRAAA